MRSRAPLQAWLSAANAINQKGMVGLCRHISSLRPAANATAAALALDFMKFVTRLGPGTFKDEVALCMPVLDEALCVSWAALKRERITVEGWWDISKDYAHLVLDPHAVEQVLNAPAAGRT